MFGPISPVHSSFLKCQGLGKDKFKEQVHTGKDIFLCVELGKFQSLTGYYCCLDTCSEHLLLQKQSCCFPVRQPLSSTYVTISLKNSLESSGNRNTIPYTLFV